MNTALNAPLLVSDLNSALFYSTEIISDSREFHDVQIAVRNTLYHWNNGLPYNSLNPIKKEDLYKALKCW